VFSPCVRESLPKAARWQAAEFTRGCQPQESEPPSQAHVHPGSPAHLEAQDSIRQDSHSMGGQLQSLPHQKAQGCFSSDEVTPEKSWPAKITTWKDAMSREET
jgi:hypothetical protein